MSTARTASRPTAAERTLQVLSPETRKNADWRHGYLDVLASDPNVSGPVQALMRSSVVSRIYERWWRPGLGRMAKGLLGPGMGDEHRIARTLLDLGGGDVALDVACGPGNFSRDFARAVGDEGLVVGIDASRAMLEQAVHDTARTGLENIVFVHGDAVAPPFREGSFDAVCCFAALHLFAEPMVALDRMKRVLGRGGRVAIFTTCASRSRPFRLLESGAEQWSGMRMFDEHEIVDALRARGFEDIRQQTAGVTQFVGARLPG